MNKSSKTNQQLLLELEELRARLAVAQQLLQEANERMQAEITERKLAEQALEERLRFERLLSDLSARFVNSPPDRVDSRIEDGLRQILEFFRVDRSGLVRTLPGRSAHQITHVAYREGVPPVPAGTELPVS